MPPSKSQPTHDAFSEQFAKHVQSGVEACRDGARQVIETAGRLVDQQHESVRDPDCRMQMGVRRVDVVGVGGHGAWLSACRSGGAHLANAMRLDCAHLAKWIFCAGSAMRTLPRHCVRTYHSIENIQLRATPLYMLTKGRYYKLFR
jgi:hypothetical protein